MPKLRAELQRRGVPTPNWAKKNTLLRWLRESQNSVGGRSRDTNMRRNNSQSTVTCNMMDTDNATSFQPAPETVGDSPSNDTTINELKDEIKQLKETFSDMRDFMNNFVSSATQGPQAPETSVNTAEMGVTRDNAVTQRAPDFRPASCADVTSPSGNFSVQNGGFQQQQQPSTQTVNEALFNHNAPTGLQEALLGKGFASSDLPHVENVSPQLRNDIIQGRDVNLASLLIQGFTSEWEQCQRTILVGADVIPLKPLRDHRLSRQLNISEFIKAFTSYKTVMCEAYPHRREELDAYLRMVVDMAHDFGGFVFYEYHKMFSARAASLLSNYGLKVDWSKKDNDMYCKVFAGRRAHACLLCSSLSHATEFCPQSSGPRGTKRDASGNQTSSGQSAKGKNFGKGKNFSDQHGRPRVFLGNVEICNNFNGDRGCYRDDCRFIHVCMICKATDHNKHNCNKKDKPTFSNNGGSTTGTGSQPNAKFVKKPASN